MGDQTTFSSCKVGVVLVNRDFRKLGAVCLLIGLVQSQCPKTPFSRCSGSVLRWHAVYVVDHEVINWNFLRYEFEAELVLKDREEGGKAGVGVAYGSETNIEIIGACDVGLIDDGATSGAGEGFGKGRNGDVPHQNPI